MRYLSSRFLVPVLLFLPFPVLAGTGCVFGCTTEARTSVSVNVVDANGAPVTDAMVTFSVDGSAPQACTSFDNSNFSCGMEQAGHFVIIASAGGATAKRELDVDADACHVEGQSLTIKLPAS
jgi:hypothetical protein